MSEDGFEESDKISDEGQIKYESCDFICVLYYPFAICLVYCKTSGLQWFHHSSELGS